MSRLKVRVLVTRVFRRCTPDWMCWASSSLGRLLAQVLDQHPGEQREAAQGVADLVGQLRGHEAHGLQPLLPGGLLGAQVGLGDVAQGDDLAGIGGPVLLLQETLAAGGVQELAQPGRGVRRPGRRDRR